MVKNSLEVKAAAQSSKMQFLESWQTAWHTAMYMAVWFMQNSSAKMQFLKRGQMATDTAVWEAVWDLLCSLFKLVLSILNTVFPHGWTLNTSIHSLSYF